MISGWSFSFLPEYQGEWAYQLQASLRNVRKASDIRDEKGCVAAANDIQSLEAIDKINLALISGDLHPDTVLRPFEAGLTTDGNLLARDEGRWLSFYRVYPEEEPPRGVIMFVVREDTDPVKLRKRLIGGK